MNHHSAYHGVIGLEVHVQLSTQTKAFSSDANLFGAVPNTNIGVVSLGQPGSLPKLNEKIPELAVKLGIATNSRIAPEICFARKHYFYADLPKAYQISQHDRPLCSGGYINIRVNGKEKEISLTRIHIEEDAGKSIHDQKADTSRIDLNRAGVPLLEIVSEPVLSNGEEAYRYLTEIRKLVQYLDISDGNMEKGNMRCDANVSVKQLSSEVLGTRTEIKNLNSINFVRKAIDYEVKRQISLIQAGDKVLQQTLRYDEAGDRTLPVRSKEEAHDYRYFPEPDLNPVRISPEMIIRIRNSMPRLPGELLLLFTGTYGLTEQTALILTESREMAGYYEAIVEHTPNTTAAANWLMGPVKKHLNKHTISISKFILPPQKIAKLINLIDEGSINYTVASGVIFNELTRRPDKDISEIIKEKQLLQSDEQDLISELIHSVLDRYPDKIKQYHQGKKGLLGLFMGELMKASRGTIDPGKATQLLQSELETRKQQL